MTRIKNFLAPYFSNILRFWTNQIVCSITGISVGLATIALDNFTVSVIGCVFSIGFVCFLQYDNMFQLGEKHHYRHIDHSRPSKTLGIKLVLIASLPLFVIILIGFILQIASLESAATVLKFIYYVVQGPYIQLHAFFTSEGILTAESLGAQCLGWLFYLLYTVPAILFSALGYVLGSLDRPLLSFLGLKRSGQKNSH